MSLQITICLLKTNLNAGTGNPWAGQLRLSGEEASLTKMRPLVSRENFGLAPPMGSIMLTFFTVLAHTWMLGLDMPELDKSGTVLIQWTLLVWVLLWPERTLAWLHQWVLHCKINFTFGCIFYLKPGMGCPWAGQSRVKMLSWTAVTLRPSVFEENLGFAPPIGSKHYAGLKYEKTNLNAGMG